jgi:PmbA protein
MHNSAIKRMNELLHSGEDKARKKGASAVKLGFSRGKSIGCQFEAGRLKTATAQQSQTFSVNVLLNGRRGSTHWNDPNDLDEMIDRAVALATSGAKAHFEAYPAPAATHQVKTWSERSVGLSRQRIIDSAQQIVDALKAYNSDMDIKAGAGRYEIESMLVTSGGVNHSTRHSGWSLIGYAQRTDGTDMLFSHYGRSWKDLNEFYDPDAIAQKILEELRQGEQTTTAPEGKVVVLLSPEMFGTFLSPVMMGVNGRNVARGDSPLQNRLGDQVCDPCLTIVDDPHLDYSNGAAEIDHDGIPTSVFPIIENGVLKTFLYDLDSAGLAGAKPTGNNGCSPYSLDVQSGEESSKKLLSSIKDGLYIKGLMGFGQGNIINGDFSSNIALGFRIRNGEIVGRVKNTMMAGNIYDLLAKNVQLSSDRDPILRLPYALIEGVNVSGGL